MDKVPNSVSPLLDINSLSQSVDWFLYDRDLRHERVHNHFIDRSKFSLAH